MREDPTPPRPPLDVRALYPQIDQIADTRLREQVEAVWQALWAQSRWTAFDDLPASDEIPYPARRHSQGVLATALAIGEQLQRVHGTVIDFDLLIAAGILQDASKVVEYDPGPDAAPVRSEIGRSFPHAFWCAHVGLAHGLPLALCHILVTHSPGSAQFPQSIEGKILYYADQINVIAVTGDRWVKHLMLERGPAVRR